MADISWLNQAAFGDLSVPNNWADPSGQGQPRVPGPGDGAVSALGNAGSITVDRIVRSILDGSAVVSASSSVGTLSVRGGATASLGSTSGSVAAESGGTVRVSGSVAASDTDAGRAYAAGGTLTVGGSVQGQAEAFGPGGALTIAGDLRGQLFAHNAGSVRVGGSASGGLLLLAGGSADVNDVSNGTGLPTSDSVGPGSSLKVGTYGGVGQNIGRTLAISGGGTATIGQILTRSLVVSLTGQGSAVNNGGSLDLELNGSLLAASGAAETLSTLTLGQQAGGSGSVTANAGGTLSLGTVTDGGQGSGSIAAAGGTVTAAILSVGTAATGSGVVVAFAGGTVTAGATSFGSGAATVVVDGVGSVFDMGSSAVVVGGRDGRINLYDGGVLRAPSGLTIGAGLAGSSDFLNVRGTKSDIITPGAPSHLELPVLTIQGGGRLAAVSALGGGIIQVADDLRIEGAGDSTSLTVAGGSTVTVGDTLDIGSQPGSSRFLQATVSGRGSRLEASLAAVVNGTLIADSGGLIVLDEAVIASGTGQGSLQLSGQGTRVEAVSVSVGESRSAARGGVTIRSGAVLDVGDGEGAVTIGGQVPSGSASTDPAAFGSGSVTVDGAGSRLQTDVLIVGGARPTETNAAGEQNGKDGAYTFSGGTGTLTVSNRASVQVGELTMHGRATFNPDGSETFLGGLSIVSGASMTVIEESAGAIDPDTLKVTSRVKGSGLITGSQTGTTTTKSGAPLPTFSLKIDATQGEIDAEDGFLVLHGDVVGNSRFAIRPNASLEIGGAFGSEQDSDGVIAFDPNATGTLIIDDLDSFHGRIENLKEGDKIVLKNADPRTVAAILMSVFAKVADKPTLRIVEGDGITKNEVVRDIAITLATEAIPLVVKVQAGIGALATTGEAVKDAIVASSVFTMVKQVGTAIGTQLGDLVKPAAPAPTPEPEPVRKDEEGQREVKVGIISSSFDAQGRYADDIRNFRLPAGIDLSHDDPDYPAPSGTNKSQDEGRAMAQIISALAPGATILFRAIDEYPGSKTDRLVAAIRDLTAAGADVIVDDIEDPRATLFNKFAIRDAINEAYQRGIFLVTSAGNGRDDEPSVPILGFKLFPQEETVAAMNIRDAPFPYQFFGQYKIPALTEDFSSLGPVSRIIVKPDITGLDRQQVISVDNLNPFEGTSAASAFIAGIAAQMMLFRSRYEGRPYELQQDLHFTALPLTEPPNYTGVGLANKYAAFAFAVARQKLDSFVDPPGVGPTVSTASVSQPASTLSTGETLQFVVNLNAPVTVAGPAPGLVLNDGGTATFVASSDVSKGQLVFAYTAAAGEATPNLAIRAVDLHGGTVRDQDGHDADFSLLIAAPTNVTVNSALSVRSAAASVTGEAVLGQPLLVALQMSEGVTVDAGGGAPVLLLSNGAVATYDAAASAPGEGRLAFTYTPAAGDEIDALQTLLVSVPDGSSVRDAGGNLADFDGVGLRPLGLQVGAAVAAQIDASEWAAGAGETVVITLSLDAPVTVTGGTPTLALSSGGTATYDPAASDPAHGALAFDYVVGSADRGTSVSITGIDVHGAAIVDRFGVAADLSGFLDVPVGFSANSPLLVSGITTDGSGPRQPGDTLNIVVQFTERVVGDFSDTFRPTALLLGNGAVAPLDLGASDLASGRLVFVYAVGENEGTGDLRVTELQLNGADLRDPGGYAADLTGIAGADLAVAIGGAVPPPTTPPPNTPPANAPPAATDDIGSTLRDVPLVVAAAALLANDQDQDGDALVLIGVGAAEHGAVSFDQATRAVTFTPDTGYSGPAAFSYTVSDGRGGQDTGAVAVTVTASGTGMGDVHYQTYDGVEYDLMASGDFLVTRALEGAPLVVQGRQVGPEGISFFHELAVGTGEHRVTFGAVRPDILRLDGTARDLAPGARLDLGAGADLVEDAPGVFRITSAAGDTVDIIVRDGFLDVDVRPGPRRAAGAFEGLLGDLDGDRGNEFALRDGTVLFGRPDEATIERAFADSWRLDSEESLLDPATLPRPAGEAGWLAT